MNLLQQTDVFGVCSWRGFVPGGKQKAKEIDFDFDFDDLEAEAKSSIHFATEGPVASSCMVVPQVITCHPATSDGKMLQLTGFNAKACTCASAGARAGTCTNACWGPCVVKHGL